MRFGSITAKEGTILETLPFRVRIRVCIRVLIRYD
jgi:hypothetical protein